MSATPAAPVGPIAIAKKLEQTPPPAGSQDVEPATLGKRKFTEKVDSWYPGMAVASTEQQKRKLCKTSLLFLELQAQVKSAIENKAKADAKERQLSLEIAQRYPIVVPVPVETPATRKPVMEIDMDYICAKKKAAIREIEIPAPLSLKVMEAARKELPAGALFSIETCLKCWREKKMAWDEVLFTVQTFASSSPALMSALDSKGQLPCGGEQATQEQMRELSMLACA